MHVVYRRCLHVPSAHRLVGDPMTVTNRPSRLDSSTFVDAIGGATRRRPLLSSWRASRRTYRRAAIALDLVAGLVVPVAVAAISGAVVLLPVLGLLAVGYVAAVALAHGYDSRRAASGSGEYKAVLAATAACGAAVVLTDFYGVTNLDPLSVTVAGMVVCLTSVASRMVLRTLARSARQHGGFSRRTLVVGSAPQLAPALRDLADVERFGFEVVGACLPADDHRDQISGVPVWGSADQASALVQDRLVDAVVVSSSAMDTDELRRFRWSLEKSDIELLVAPNLSEVLSDRVGLRSVSTTPLLSVSNGPTGLQRVAKSVFDRVVAAALLAVFSPMIGAAALLVRATSSGPAMFRQQRVGVDGTPFTMLKIRTMVVDAEARKDRLAATDGNQVLFKMARDPRITAVGAVLRRFSIDELPQLWNVLRGEMSLVGPRPPLPSEVAKYDVMAVHRLHVRPGLTGLWQVSGRSDLDWEHSVRLDLRYVDNWSMSLDLKILARTFGAVLGARGAY